MKLRLITLTAVTMLLVACSTKKTVAEAPLPPTPPVTKTVELTPELAEGKSLYENSCVKCHKLYEPKQFSQDEWKPILVRMQKKAKLDDVKMASITNYIHSQL